MSNTNQTLFTIFMLTLALWLYWYAIAFLLYGAIVLIFGLEFQALYAFGILFAMLCFRAFYPRNIFKI